VAQGGFALSVDTWKEYEPLASILVEKDARDILALEMSKTTISTDFFVICTMNSPKQMAAVRDALLEELKRKQFKILFFDKGNEYDWMVVDAGDVVFHLFSKKGRDYYRLEDLWNGVRKIRISS